MLLYVPIIGGLVEKTIVARTMRTLGTLVSSGVPILEALAIVRETCNNGVFERMFQRVYESIREGDTIAAPLKESRLVDDMVINMIDVGEETGDLDTMLYKVSDVYDEEVKVLVEGLLAMLEPLMIVFLGLIIGTIIVALFMPLIKLLERLGVDQASGVALSAPRIHWALMPPTARRLGALTPIPARRSIQAWGSRLRRAAGKKATPLGGGTFPNVPMGFGKSGNAATTREDLG